MGGRPKVTWAALGPTPRHTTWPDAESRLGRYLGGELSGSWVPGTPPTVSGIHASSTAEKAALSLPRITS